MEVREWVVALVSERRCGPNSKQFIEGRDDLWLVEDWAEVDDRFLANALQELFERVTGRRGIGALRESEKRTQKVGPEVERKEAVGYAEHKSIEERIEPTPLGGQPAGRDQLYQDRVFS